MDIKGSSQNRRLKLLTLAYDTATSGLAFYLAMNIAFGRTLHLAYPPDAMFAVIYTIMYGGIAAIMLYWQRVYRGIWCYTSLGDCISILRAVTLTVLLFVPIVFVMTRAEELPRSAPIIAGLLMMALLIAPRVLARALADRYVPLPFATRGVTARKDTVPIIVAGEVARIEAFVREVQRQETTPYSVVGILTKEKSWHGRTMHGIGVLGGPTNLGNSLAFLRQRKIEPHRLIIADDQADETEIADYLDRAAQHGLTLGRLPRLMGFDGTISASHSIVQPINLGDLLGRPQIVLDLGGMRSLIASKRVLVTGAGGSIGSELVRQISDLEPAEVVLLDSSEFNLYSIDKELEERHPDLIRISALCDVRDCISIKKWFSERRPEVVFHAAALKHVPLVEHHPIEGVRTNVLGTKNVADACIDYGVTAMVLISTDKAVNPSNVMGATKRCAEAYCQALDAQGHATRFVSVRFGNVLGSSGSVVPLFQRQLAAGGPITVTHPDITRFFMTIPEAVTLVLQASVLGVSDRMLKGSIYVLNMGKPIKITDLARQMIRLSGKEPDRDIKIVYIGLRSGEKLYEEVVHKEENLHDTQVKDVMIVSPRTADLAILQNQFAEIGRATADLNLDRCLRLLHLIVPCYRASIPHDSTDRAHFPTIAEANKAD